MTEGVANRHAVPVRTQGAKQPETHAQRIEKFAGMPARGEKVYP